MKLLFVLIIFEEIYLQCLIKMIFKFSSMCDKLCAFLVKFFTIVKYFSDVCYQFWNARVLENEIDEIYNKYKWHILYLCNEKNKYLKCKYGLTFLLSNFSLMVSRAMGSSTIARYSGHFFHKSLTSLTCLNVQLSGQKLCISNSNL